MHCGGYKVNCTQLSLCLSRVLHVLTTVPRSQYATDPTLNSLKFNFAFFFFQVLWICLTLLVSTKCHGQFDPTCVSNSLCFICSYIHEIVLHHQLVMVLMQPMVILIKLWCPFLRSGITLSFLKSPQPHFTRCVHCD